MQIEKIYLLSDKEVSKNIYGFSSNYHSKSKYSKVTPYVKDQGAKICYYSKYSGNCGWALRDISIYNRFSGIDEEGYNWTGTLYPNYKAVIRPVLHLDLSSAEWKYAGVEDTELGSILPDSGVESTPTTTPTTEPTVAPTTEPTATPTTEPTVTPTTEPTATPTTEPTVAPTTVPTATPTPTPVPQQTATPITDSNLTNNTQPNNSKVQLKTIKLTSVMCKKGTKKIIGKVSVSGATIKIKVGSKAYRKAVVKGKKFNLKVEKLKKKMKVTIAVTKVGYKKLIKVYKVK